MKIFISISLENYLFRKRKKERTYSCVHCEQKPTYVIGHHPCLWSMQF